MEKLQVEYVEYGLANNFGDHIEMNKALLQNKELHDAIIDHEFKHTQHFFSKQDLLVDLSENKVSSWKVLKFMVQNPKTFTQLLPVYYTKRYGFVYDLNLIIVYVVIIGLGIGTLFLTNYI